MEETGKERQGKCRFCFPVLGKNIGEYRCVADSRKDDRIRTVTAEDCSDCEKYDSKFIGYPISVTDIKNGTMKGRFTEDSGKPCEIAPCGEEYAGKSYLGIYLGELPWVIATSYDRETGILNNNVALNPAIFVPELKKIVFGAESWWRLIEKPENFKGISQDDIENTWYVQMFKAMCDNPNTTKNEV